MQTHNTQKPRHKSTKRADTQNVNTLIKAHTNAIANNVQKPSHKSQSVCG